MCNEFEDRVAWLEYKKVMTRFLMKVPPRQGPADLPQADSIRITDPAPVMVLPGHEVELRQMRFSWPGPTGAPVFNFKSEGRSFKDSLRCLIPASAFFEFTGTKSPKTKHRFTLNDAPFMAIAGLWRPGEGNQPPGFAMLTTAPGPDVAPIHNRQIAVLRPEEWRSWLWLDKPEAELLRPLPAGTLSVETIRPQAARLSRAPT